MNPVLTPSEVAQRWSIPRSTVMAMTKPKVNDRRWRPGRHTEPLAPENEEDLGDPANGEKVPRCGSCGRPSERQNRVLTFALTLDTWPAGRYRLCEQCHRYANPPDPRATDPLTAV